MNFSLTSFGYQIIYLKEVDSTNTFLVNYIRHNKTQEGLVVRADYQLAGKGRMEKKWESKKGENLLFSLLIRPKILLSDQFLLSKIFALGVAYFLESEGVKDVYVKWPNDIYAGSAKIGGILIENQVLGMKLNSAVVGIGLNINQEVFDVQDRNVSSLSQETGKVYDLSLVLDNLLKVLSGAYLLLKDESKIHESYHKYLLGVGEERKFKDQSGVFLGEIVKVDKKGKLQIAKNGTICSYGLDEIVFL